MAEVKKYYWLKLKKDFFKRHDIRIIEEMPNGKDYVLLYLKLLVESISHEGSLRFSDTIPYNEQMIATVTNTNIDIVRSAMKVFENLHMVDILDDETIYMTEVKSLVGSETEWARKKRIYRQNQPQIEDKQRTLKGQCPKKEDNVRQEIEKEKELEIDIDKDKNKPIPYQEISDLYNSICLSFPRLTKLSDARKKAIKARLNIYTIDDFKKLFTMAESSDFLKGKNDRNWSATFDWLIKDSNMAKVLDGNFKNSIGQQAKPKATNKFNQFPQRGYTTEQMSEIERKLINKSLGG